MRRSLVFGLILLLSGAVAIAASAGLCEPMPCCVDQAPEFSSTSTECCGISAAPEDQPRNTTAKPTVDPKRSACSPASTERQPASHLNRQAVTIDISPPPTVHKRLATLSILLI